LANAKGSVGLDDGKLSEESLPLVDGPFVLETFLLDWSLDRSLGMSLATVLDESEFIEEDASDGGGVLPMADGVGISLITPMGDTVPKQQSKLMPFVAGQQSPSKFNLSQYRLALHFGSSNNVVWLSDTMSDPTSDATSDAMFVEKPEGAVVDAIVGGSVGCACAIPTNEFQYRI
jgi:hypothetical protein